MLIFCKKCGTETEQNYLGICFNPPRIATRCHGCLQTNFADAWKVHQENQRIKHAVKANLIAPGNKIQKEPLTNELLAS